MTIGDCLPANPGNGARNAITFITNSFEIATESGTIASEKGLGRGKGGGRKKEGGGGLVPAVRFRTSQFFYIRAGILLFFLCQIAANKAQVTCEVL